MINFVSSGTCQKNRTLEGVKAVMRILLKKSIIFKVLKDLSYS